MRQKDGRYECAFCAEMIEIEHDAVPTVLFHGASGEPSVRIITVQGLEVHRCLVVDVTLGSWHTADWDSQTPVG
jgi:hypothetical protein